MSTATASAALETIDLGSSELDYDAVLRAASNIHPMLRTAFMAEQLAGLEGDAGGFGFGADDFGKRAFDANNAGRKAGLIGNDIEEQEREEEEARLDDFKSSMEAYLADWRISTHMIGGYNFTGAELDEVAENLKDPAFREQNKAYLKRTTGWSDEKIDRLQDAYLAYHAAQQVPPEKRTAEQNAAITSYESNPDGGTFIKRTQEHALTMAANNVNQQPNLISNTASPSYAESISKSNETDLFSAKTAFTNTSYASQSNTIEEIPPSNRATLTFNV